MLGPLDEAPSSEEDIMHSELCPRCGILRNMQVSTSQRKVIDPEGNTKEILTRVFHCETCNSFVRSEDIEEPEDHPHDESTQKEPLNTNAE
jgi:hypothetical protein